MATATIQVRVLAVAAPSLWVAAGGTLGPTTMRVLHYCLCARVAHDRTRFFLDLTELEQEEDFPPGRPPELLPAGAGLSFHVVGARSAVHRLLADDPRCRFHSDVAAAWSVWTGPA